MADTTTPGNGSPSPLREGLDPSLGLLARGSVLNVAGMLYEFAARFAFNVIVARLLGPGPVGIYFLALSVVSVLGVMAQGGFDTALVRFLSQQRSQGDWARLRGTLRFSLGAVAVLGTGLAAGLALAAPWVGTGIFGKPELVTPLLLVAVAIPLFALEAALLAVTQALKEVKYKVYIAFLYNPTAKIVLTVLFVRLGWGLTGVLLAYVLTMASSAALAFAGMRRCLPAEWRSAEARVEVGEVVRYTYPLFGVNVVSHFRSQADFFVVGHFLAAEIVGIYAVCLRFASFAVFALPAVSYLFAPIFAELNHQGRREDSGQALQTATLWAVQIYLPLLLLFLLGGRVLLGLFGEPFTTGATALAILMVGLFLHVATGPIGSALNMSGSTGLQFWNAMGTLVVQAGLAIWLVPRWGLLGAALANATGLTVINSARVVQLLWREKIQPFSLHLMKPIAAAALALLLGLWMGGPLASMTLSRLVWVYATVVLTYFGVLVSLGFDPHSQRALQEVRGMLARYSWGLIPPPRTEENL